MKRTELKRKSRSRSGSSKAKEFSDDIKTSVFNTFGGKCGLCSKQIAQFHHRKMRSQGGMGELENCLPVCEKCHRMIHDHPDWSYRHGLLVRSTRDPALVPIFPNCTVLCDEEHCFGV